jgi:putative FmdB family regulatory protein
MPIYEYRCHFCGHEFEQWQKITEPAISRCKICGGHASRLISHSSFILKGTGWYVTDYARKDGASSCRSTVEKSSPAASSNSDSDSKSVTVSESVAEKS